jgi:hypothetical protein
MPHMIFATKNYEADEIVTSEGNQELSFFIDHLRNGIWAIGIPSWLFAVSDRLIAISTDSYISVWEITQLFTVFFFLISWLYLKPAISLADIDQGEAREQLDIKPEALDLYENIVAKRMLQLQKQHMIQQKYTLPFPYQCQIYHLLNLKHLETIHSFSLNNLKVINVIHTQATKCGGKIKFQTVLDSPFNVLRIWRQPMVEVNLILHTPYMIELSIPLYNQKQLAVLFNAIPLSDRTHRLFIDIYSDLKFPKPILQWILHLASSLTLFEDLPYLRKLAARSTHRLGDVSKGSNCKTMWLYQRFIQLYGQF